MYNTSLFRLIVIIGIIIAVTSAVPFLSRPHARGTFPRKYVKIIARNYNDDRDNNTLSRYTSPSGVFL